MLLCCLISPCAAHDGNEGPPRQQPIVKAKPQPVPPAIQKLHEQRNKDAPMDEPEGGMTRKGTPVTYRTKECFPAETRDLFWEMDQVASGPNGKLEPLNFDKDGNGTISDEERDAIRGRNTWLLWGGGNESFWGWLTEDGYGLSDFMIMIDSRRRNQRFENMGVMNQPDFEANHNKTILGLYFDRPGPKGAYPKPSPYDFDESGKPVQRKYPPVPHPMNLIPTDGAVVPDWDPVTGMTRMVDGKPVKDRPVADLIKEVEKDLPKDGLDYSVYGYPTGIIGLRLMLNPDFFGNTEDADTARRRWQEKVLMTNGRYYNDPSLNADRHLVRPFRLSMSCGYCHVSPHPLNPPKENNNPRWENLSSIIGGQYWKPQPSIGNLPKADSILFHFLNSQEPGTVDTSGFSPDQLNNGNTINAVFQLNARIERARLNPPETQSIGNLRLPNIEAVPNLPAILDAKQPEDRLTTRVLLDGSDSVGAYGALARVYLNIGTFSEYWNTRSNPLIGFTKQKVFDLKTCQSNSVYWMTNETYRAKYLAKFFTFTRPATTTPTAANPSATEPPPAPSAAPTPTPPAAPKPTTSAQNATGPMKLRTALMKDGQRPSSLFAGTKEQRLEGRKVWLRNCATCHSSKQPNGFTLKFDRNPAWKADWTKAPKGTDATYTLPMDADHWTAFKRSPSYLDYLQKITALVETEGGPAKATLEDDPWDKDHPFWENNYLSTDLRLPLTLVGTNPARSLGTNAIRGNVWDNLSSDSYKALPSVGTIKYYDPFASIGQGNNTNAEFAAPDGGVGYYRPATHVALWATAPFLHNNTLGYYNGDPTVEGRLLAYEDGMRRMLWPGTRADPKLQIKPLPPGLAESFPTFVAARGSLADTRNRRVGDLRRDDGTGPAAHDPGYIYRLPNDTFAHFAPSFIRPLIEGTAGKFITSLITFWAWPILLIGFLWIYCRFRVRHAGILFLLLAGLSIFILTSTGMTGGGTTTGALLAGAASLLRWSSAMWFILCGVLLLLAVMLLFAPETESADPRDSVQPDHPQIARNVILVVLAGVLLSMLLSHAPWWCQVIVLVLGLLLAWRWRFGLRALLRYTLILPLILATIIGGWVANRFVNGKTILHIPIANVTIGPLPVEAGPFPRGMPLNLLLNANPDSKDLGHGLASMFVAIAKIKQQGLEGEAAYEIIRREAGEALIKASKCPDYVLDHGHLFPDQLSDEQGRPLPEAANNEAKEALLSFLKTL
jgi:hypothetical protein